MPRNARVIDASLRFLRTNPQLVAYAHAASAQTGRSVDELLLDAASRCASGREAVAQQEVIARASR